jgi:hypothetical protein
MQVQGKKQTQGPGSKPQAKVIAVNQQSEWLQNSAWAAREAASPTRRSLLADSFYQRPLVVRRIPKRNLNQLLLGSFGMDTKDYDESGRPIR